MYIYAVFDIPTISKILVNLKLFDEKNLNISELIFNIKTKGIFSKP